MASAAGKPPSGLFGKGGNLFGKKTPAAVAAVKEEPQNPSGETEAEGSPEKYKGLFGKEMKPAAFKPPANTSRGPVPSLFAKSVSLMLEITELFCR